MATYVRQSSFSDGDTITAALFNNEFNQLVNAFNVATGHTHDGSTAGDGGPISNLFSNALVFGTNTDNDVVITFNAASNDGVLSWMEDEDYFQFSDDLLIATSEKIQFRDTAIYINSSTDGQLDIVADTEVQIAATTIDMNGNADISGNLGVGGNLTVTGTTTFNGGTITMGDAATDNVVFGADVDSHIIPDDDDTYDLGSSTQEWRNLYIDGTANIDSLVADTADINGGTIDAANITVGSGKTLDVSAGTLTLADNQISGDKVEGGTINATTINTLTYGSITDGTITVTAFVDEDDMSSNSATLIPTQQSVKAYVDAQDTAQDLDLVSDSGTIAIDLDGETLTVTGGEGIDTSASSNTLTITGENATTSNKGIASFNSDDFNVSSGAVTLATTSTAAELNILDGATLTTAELNILDGVTSTAAELNLLDGKAFLDEDDMASNSATGIASQQSIKAYVDSQVTAQDLDFQGDTGGALSIDLDSESLTIAGGTGLDTVGSGNTVTVNIDSTVATLTGSQTLTNKSLTAPTLTGTATVASLDISGDIDVDGTTNLDVVDIDGAVAMATSLTIGGTSPRSNYVLDVRSSGGNGLNIQAGDESADVVLAVGSTSTADKFTITSGGAVTTTGVVTANAGVVVDTMTLDGSTLTSTGDFIVDAAADIIFDADANDVLFKDGGTEYFRITNNGTSFVRLDAVGDIILDADGGDIYLDDGGTGFGQISGASSNLTIKSSTADKDIIFQGNDNGSTVTALTLDMSAAGKATFSDAVDTGGTITVNSGNINLPTDGGTIFFGADVDMRMFHDGSNGKITNSTGGFYIGSDIIGLQNAAHNTTYLSFASGGAATFNSTVGVAGVGVIGATDGDLNIYSTAASHAGLRLGNGYVAPTNNAGTITNDAISLGLSGQRFTNLYLSDSIQNSGKAGSGTVFNEDGTTADFRVESDSQAYMFFINGGTNKIGIGHSVPDTELHVIANGNNAQMPFIIGNEDHTDNSTSQSVAMGFGLARDSGTVKNNAGLISVGKTAAWTADDAQIDSYMGLSIYKNNTSTETMRIESDKVRLGNTSDYVMVDISASNAAIELVDNSQANPPTLRGNGPNFTIENGGVERMRIDTGVVFNETGIDQDFRVESDGNTHAIFVDASTNRVGILNNNPAYAFHVDAEVASSAYFRVDSSSTYAGTSLMTLKRNGNNTGDYLQMRDSSNNLFATFDEGGIIFNEIGGDTDFRVESNNNSNILFIDASADTVNIGNTTDFGGILNVNGGLNSKQAVFTSTNNRGLALSTASRGGQNDGVAIIDAQDTESTGGRFEIHTMGAERARFERDQIVFNDSSNDQDFRVESNGNTHMLFVDGGNNTVGIGTTASVDETLTVQGEIRASGNDGAVRVDSGSGGYYLNLTQTYAHPYSNSYIQSVAGSSYHGRLIFEGNTSGGSMEEFLRMSTAEGVVFNENGIDKDFRVESNGNANMLFVDGGNDLVKLGNDVFGNAPTVSSGDFVHFNTGAIAVSSSGSSTVNLFTRSPDANVSATGTVFLSGENSGGSVQFGVIIDFFFSNGTLNTTARETGSSQGTVSVSVQENGAAISITVAYSGGLGGAIRYSAGGQASICSY